MYTNDNRKVYFIQETYTLEWKNYLPGQEHPMVWISALIFEKNGSWEITSESFESFRGKQVFANHSDEILHMIKSFSLDSDVQQQAQATPTPTKSVIIIPDWIKKSAEWWTTDLIDDSTFLQGIQYLIKEGIMVIPPTAASESSGSQEIPGWVKNNAGWWADGQIDDNSFVSGIQYLVKVGIIKVS